MVRSFLMLRLLHLKTSCRNNLCLRKTLSSLSGVFFFFLLSHVSGFQGWAGSQLGGGNHFNQLVTSMSPCSCRTDAVPLWALDISAPPAQRLSPGEETAQNLGTSLDPILSGRLYISTYMYIKCTHQLSFPTHLQQGIVQWSRPRAGLEWSGQVVHTWACGTYSAPLPLTALRRTHAAQKRMSASVLQQTVMCVQARARDQCSLIQVVVTKVPLLYLVCRYGLLICELVEEWTLFPVSLAFPLSWHSGWNMSSLMNTVNCSGRQEGTGVQLRLESRLRKVCVMGNQVLNGQGKIFFKFLKAQGIKLSRSNPVL